MSGATAGGVPPPPPISGRGNDVPKPSNDIPVASEASTHAQVQYPNNPGLFESFHKTVRDILQPETFEGAKLVFNKALSSHFQLTHTLLMSNAQPPGYKFGATFVGDTKRSESEMFPVLLGELEPSGDMNFQLIHQFTDHVRGKCSGQIHQGAVAGWSATSEWRGAQTNAALVLGNVDPLSGSGTFVLETMRNVTKRLTLGSQLIQHRSPLIPGGGVAMWMIAARYTLANGKTVLGATVSPLEGSLHTTYYRRISDSLQIASELQLDASQRAAVGRLGYQYELPRANTTFRAQLDSALCCEAIIEKRLVPLPFTLTLCAQAMHRKPAYRFGIGFTVG